MAIPWVRCGVDCGPQRGRKPGNGRSPAPYGMVWRRGGVINLSWHYYIWISV